MAGGGIIFGQLLLPYYSSTARHNYVSFSPSLRCRFKSRRWLSVSYSFGGYSRFDGFRASCSMFDTNLQLEGISADEDSLESLSCSATNCPTPIVNVNPEFLEAEPLHMLSERSYVDNVLTALPVLTEEEQNVLAATPAHPAGLYSLYANCLAGNFVKQMWDFACPAAIAMIHPSLLPVAVMGFFTKLAMILWGPLVGKLMDHLPRVPAYNCLSSIQTVAQLISVAMIVHAHRVPSSSVSSIFRPWFIILVVAGAIERLCGLALGVAMERDWLVLLAGTNRPIALAQANAVFNRIDLLCEVSSLYIFILLMIAFHIGYADIMYFQHGYASLRITTLRFVRISINKLISRKGVPLLKYLTSYRSSLGNEGIDVKERMGPHPLLVKVA